MLTTEGNNTGCRWPEIANAAMSQALDDDEMMRQYAQLLARQDTAREDALKSFQARTAMRAEVAGLEVPTAAAASQALTPLHPHSHPPCVLRFTASRKLFVSVTTATTMHLCCAAVYSHLKTEVFML